MVDSDWYYRAGCVQGESVMWSESTRYSSDAAEAEAEKMAARWPGSRPVVEYWGRWHGRKPLSADVVMGFYYPDRGVFNG